VKKTSRKKSKHNKSHLKEKLTVENQKYLRLEQKVLDLEDQLKTNDITNNENQSILHTRIEQLEMKLDDKNRSYLKLYTEQEELYVVLAEKSIEIKNYKRQLGLPDEEEGDGEEDEDV